MANNEEYIIVDIDNTIALINDRLKYITGPKKDYTAFYKACYEDSPIINIIQLVQTLYMAGYNIIYCTGRSDICRKQTQMWLNDYLLPDGPLLMRKNKDYRSDTIVKPELLKKYDKNIFNKIYLVLEDRNKMVKAWRELGLTCLQVRDGDF